MASDRPGQADQVIEPVFRIGRLDMTFVVIGYGADVVLVSVVARLGDVPLAAYRLMVTIVTVEVLGNDVGL